MRTMFLGGEEWRTKYIMENQSFTTINAVHYMYPNEARLRNMTYGFSIHYDVDIVFTFLINDGEPVKSNVKRTDKDKAKDGPVFFVDVKLGNDAQWKRNRR